MTLDDLIDLLLEVRQRYPGAASAYVVCPVNLAEPMYEKGQLLLGLTFDPPDDNDEDDDDEDDDEGVVH